MIDIRYQVFISSTFTDLQIERAKVQQAVMELECIPAGMEAFPAIDEEQFEFIKKVIDDCDYYLLIIGGRYGSVSNEGISYTEMEYEYAISKGIKMIVLLHKDPTLLPLGKSEQSPANKKRLLAFRKKASSGRLVRYWNNADELPGLVASSLSKTIRTYPAVGWIRANSLSDPAIYKEVNELRKDNDRLKEALGDYSFLEKKYGIAGLEDHTVVSGSYAIGNGFYMQYITTEWKINVTWGEIFKIISPILLMHSKDQSVRNKLAEELPKISGAPENVSYWYIGDDDFNAIRIQLRALDLIIMTPSEGTLVWSLTPAGERILIIEKAIKISN